MFKKGLLAYKTQAQLKSEIADKRLWNLLSIRFKKLWEDSKKPRFKLTRARLDLMKRYRNLAVKMFKKGSLSFYVADDVIYRVGGILFTHDKDDNSDWSWVSWPREVRASNRPKIGKKMSVKAFNALLPSVPKHNPRLNR